MLVSLFQQTLQVHYRQSASPKELPLSKNLYFGRTFVSYVLVSCMLRPHHDPAQTYAENDFLGLSRAPGIVPCRCKLIRLRHGPDMFLRVFSSAKSVCHSATYAYSLFEGMKPYRHEDGTVVMSLFPPDLNKHRRTEASTPLHREGLLHMNRYVL
jgi:hypothetical protein